MKRARTMAGAFAALAVSGALHAAGMLAALPRVTPVALPGGGGAEPASLGTAFEDLAAGAIPVVAAITPPVPPDPATQPARPALRPVPVTPVSAGDAPAVRPSTATLLARTTETTALPPRTAAVVSSATAQAPTTKAEADLVASAIALAAVAPPEALAAPPRKLSSSVPSETVAPAAPSHAVSASSDLAPESAARPPGRPEPRRTEVGPMQPPAGNAAIEARRGDATGQDGARGAASGPDAPSSVNTGNAAASSYPGLVLRQITRLRRPRAPDRGTVVVAFQVAGSGALASVTVARSSGSAALDRLALDHIRRAAPFPPPPAGAEVAFSFAFEGRP